MKFLQTISSSFAREEQHLVDVTGLLLEDGCFVEVRIGSCVCREDASVLHCQVHDISITERNGRHLQKDRISSRQHTLSTLNNVNEQ